MIDRILSPTRRAFLGMSGAALLWPHDGHADAIERISGTAFGTTWSIVGRSGGGLARIRPDIEALFDGIDRQLSPWRADSALSRFNAGGAGRRAADDEMIRVTASALALAERTDGAFDPTVGPLVARWGFGPIEAGGAPDWRGLSVDAGGIAKARDDLTLDLCGIAKGRALDRAAGIASEAGFEDLLLDLGGELGAIGRHPSGRTWRVAVQHPTQDGVPPAALRLPAGMSVATSGSRSQSYALDGRAYGHIIDPAALAPADGALASVTVLAADAMTADGWATALFAAGDVAGPALAREHDISALFLVGNGDGLRRLATGAIEGALL